MYIQSKKTFTKDKNNYTPSIQFRDNRPISFYHTHLQESITQSPKSVAQRAKIDASTAPIQKKENKTGLPDRLKNGIENLSGMDMSDTRVHYNSSKPAQLQAHAYAQGNQIHLAPGQEKHLPHEAWHVVQQKQGRVQPTMQMKGKVKINDNAGLEHEADVMGAKALQSASTFTKTHNNQQSSQAGTVQRKISIKKSLNKVDGVAGVEAVRDIVALLKNEWPSFYNKFKLNKNTLVFSGKADSGYGATSGEVELKNGTMEQLPLTKDEMKQVKPNGKSRIEIVINPNKNKEVFGKKGKLLQTLAHEITLHGLAFADEIDLVQNTSKSSSSRNNISKANYKKGGVWNSKTQHRALARGEHPEYNHMVDMIKKGFTKDEIMDAMYFNSEVDSDKKGHSEYDKNKYAPQGNKSLVSSTYEHEKYGDFLHI